MKDWSCGYHYPNFEKLHTLTQRVIAEPRYHGTPLAPDQLRGHEILPAQSVRRPSGNPKVNHGPRAVSTSKLPAPFPAVRALFHDQQPAFREALPDFYLARAENIRNESHIFIGAFALRQLIASQATGYIYGCDGRRSEPFPERADLAEYRTPHAITWHTCTEITTADLPRDLYVVTGSYENSWQFIKEYKAGSTSPEDLAKQMGSVALETYAAYLKMDNY